MPITGGPPPSIGPNKYRFLYKMLCVNACARAPAESLLRVYERRKQQQLTATVSRFYYSSQKKVATLFDAQNAGNCISEDLDFKILWGIMPPAPLD